MAHILLAGYQQVNSSENNLTCTETLMYTHDNFVTLSVIPVAFPEGSL